MQVRGRDEFGDKSARRKKVLKRGGGFLVWIFFNAGDFFGLPQKYRVGHKKATRKNPQKKSTSEIHQPFGKGSKRDMVREQ